MIVNIKSERIEEPVMDLLRKYMKLRIISFGFFVPYG